MDFLHQDVHSLLSQLKHQDKQLKLKRRWLMGLPLSISEQKEFKAPKLPNERTLPESLLREDDVYYETIKNIVEKGFEASAVKRDHHVVQETMQLYHLSSDERDLFSLLDHMTNKGLYVFAKMLTGGSTNFEKTRLRMKKIIRECLPKVLGNQRNSHQVIISKQISELLSHPHNFRGTSLMLLTPASQSHHAAAKVLDGLEDFPFQTLSAMHRKLRCIQGYMPQLHPSKSGWARSILIEQVRKSSRKMLSQLGEEDELQKPLAKAMAVAGLSLKLILGCKSVIEFEQFAPEIEALQNEIAKAIWLLKEKVRFPELKNLQLLLDPNAELSHRSSRAAVRNLLTEYLLECSDMDTIPKCLLETLAIINKSSRSAPRRFFSKKDIEEEVECVLSVSAQTKQVVWDLVPEYDEFDQNYVDAYMDDLEESDNSYDDNYDQQQSDILQNSRVSDANDEIESTGETDPLNSNLPASCAKGNGSVHVLTTRGRLNEDLMDSPFFDSSTSGWESKVFDSPQNWDGNRYHLGSTRSSGLGEQSIDPTKHSKSVTSNLPCGDENKMNRNQYLAIQEACDETSTLAYHLVGHIMNGLAQVEGFDLDWDEISYLRGNDLSPKHSRVTKKEQMSLEEDMHGSVIIQVLVDLIPLFPKSGKECVKKLMGSK